MKRAEIFLLAGIIIFGLFTRLYGLSEESFHIDEYYSFYTASHSISDIFFHHLYKTNANTIPPLYEILLHFWMNIAGNADIVQRLLSVLFSLIGVYFLYLLTKLLVDEKTGLIVSFLFSFSLVVLYFSRMSRCYSLFVALIIASFYLFFVFLREKRNLAVLTALCGVNILLLYTHYFSFLALFFQVVIALMERIRINDRNLLKKIVIVQVVSFIFFSFWMPNFILDISREPILYMDPGKSPFSNDFTVKELMGNLLFTGIAQNSLILAILFLFFIFYGFLKKRNLKLNVLYLFSFSVLSIIIIDLVTNSIDRSRYYVGFIFPIFILIANGIKEFGQQSRFIKTGFIIIIILGLSVFEGGFLKFYREPILGKWKQYAEYIKGFQQNKKSKMLIAFSYNDSIGVFGYYFWGKSASKELLKPRKRKSFLSKKEKNIKVLRVNEAKQELQNIQELKNSISEGFKYLWVFDYHGIDEKGKLFRDISSKLKKFSFVKTVKLKGDRRSRIHVNLFEYSQ